MQCACAVFSSVGFLAIPYCTGIITHSQCVFVALVIQRAMSMRRILICGLSGCTILHWKSKKSYTFSVCVCSLSYPAIQRAMRMRRTLIYGLSGCTILHWKSNKSYTFSVCVCSLSYPACNAHAPYCHLWPVRLLTYFFHIIS